MIFPPLKFKTKSLMASKQMPETIMLNIAKINEVMLGIEPKPAANLLK
jgi:hypothetical protein